MKSSIGKRLTLLLLVLLPMQGFAESKSSATIQQFTLTNGLTVLLSESHAVPMVEAKLVMAGGSAYDPKGKEGLASMTATLLPLGAGEYDSEAFMERLDFYGVRISSEAGQDLLVVNLDTLTDQMEEGWARFSDAVLRPRFEAKTFRKERAKQIDAILKAQEQPDYRVKTLFYKTLYQGHPYSHVIEGDARSLKALNVKDLRAFYKKALHAPGMVLAVAGDITLSRLQELVERHLRGIDSTPSPFQPLPKAAIAAHGERHAISMESPQTAIWIGSVGIDRNDPDFFPIVVLNHIFGGGTFSSRLTEQIREKRGLTYHISSNFYRYSARGPFLINVRTKNDSVDEVLRLVNIEVALMALEGPSEQEVKESKQYLTGSFPMRLDSNGEMVGNLSNIGFFKLGNDYLDTWQARIEAVTRDDVARVAKRFLRPEQLFVVSAGGKSTQPELPGKSR